MYPKMEWMFKILFLVFVFYIFEVSLKDIEYVSPMLTKNKTGTASRFTHGKKTYFIQSQITGNYHRALQFCRQRKMQLLTIENKEENDKIGKFLLENNLGSGHFWTSGSNLAGDGQWIWLSTGNNINYFNWLPGEPSGTNGRSERENCIEVRHWYQHGFAWNDMPCSYEAWFICERLAN